MHLTWAIKPCQAISSTQILLLTVQLWCSFKLHTCLKSLAWRPFSGVCLLMCQSVCVRMYWSSSCVSLSLHLSTDRFSYTINYFLNHRDGLPYSKIETSVTCCLLSALWLFGEVLLWLFSPSLALTHHVNPWSSPTLLTPDLIWPRAFAQRNWVVSIVTKMWADPCRKWTDSLSQVTFPVT